MSFINKFYSDLEYAVTLNIKNSKPIESSVPPDILISYLMDRYDEFTYKSILASGGIVASEEEYTLSMTLEMLKRVINYKIAYEISENKYMLSVISKKLHQTNNINKTRTKVKNICDMGEIKKIYNKLSQYLNKMYQDKLTIAEYKKNKARLYNITYKYLDIIKSNHSKLVIISESENTEFGYKVTIKKSVVNKLECLVNSFIEA
jgi:hypothetical protein